MNFMFLKHSLRSEQNGRDYYRHKIGVVARADCLETMEGIRATSLVQSSDTTTVQVPNASVFLLLT